MKKSNGNATYKYKDIRDVGTKPVLNRYASYATYTLCPIKSL